MFFEKILYLFIIVYSLNFKVYYKQNTKKFLLSYDNLMIFRLLTMKKNYHKQKISNSFNVTFFKALNIYGYCYKKFPNKSSLLFS